MTISKKYARALVKAGKATIENATTTDERGTLWRIVTRHDLQRVDHYRIGGRP